MSTIRFPEFRNYIIRRVIDFVDEQHYVGPRRPLGDEQLPRTVARQASGTLGGARRLGSGAVDGQDTRRSVHGVRSQRQPEEASKDIATVRLSDTGVSRRTWPGSIVVNVSVLHSV